MEKSIKEFSKLHIRNEIKEALASNGFINMTPVQSSTIPHMLSHKDVIVQSQTGSGKTLSYLIPIAQSIDKNAKHIQAMIIVPTRELCNQIKEVSQIFNIKTDSFVGGLPIENDLNRLNTTLFVATPGRLLEILQADSKPFQKVRFLILDESDKLLSHGFESVLLKILMLLPKLRTTGLFSATVNEAVKSLSLHSLKNPIEIKVNENLPEKLDLKYILVRPENKIDLLLQISENKKCIVFFSTCAEVEFFYHLFNKSLVSKSLYNKEIKNVKIEPKKSKTSSKGKIKHVMIEQTIPTVCDEETTDIPESFKICKIHGKMDQSERNKIYDRFHNDGRYLFCTDVAARGIDFKNIDLVVHFDIPKEHTNIVHRSGRTARNGTEGESVIFIMPNEIAYIDYLKIKKINLSRKKISNSDTNLNENSLNPGTEKERPK